MWGKKHAGGYNGAPVSAFNTVNGDVAGGFVSRVSVGHIIVTASKFASQD